MSTGKIKINLDSLKTRREWKRHKVKDGSNVYRILPPFGEASNGYPYKKWQIIWGLQDPESGRARPFASSMTSEKRCPVTEYVLLLKKKAETLKSELAQAGVSEEEANERAGALQKLISDLNPKTVFIYNAADKSGEVGLLELKSTAQKQMKAEMTNYIQEYNQDPTSLNSDDTDSGLWFNITRAGLGRDTEYAVKKVQIKTKNPTTGKISFEDDRSPLPDAVVENYANLGYDLNSVYQVKSYDELADILEANMASIVDVCPDADLNGSVVFESTVLGKVNPVAPFAGVFSKPVGTKTVALKMDDDGDDDSFVPTPAQIKQAKQAALNQLIKDGTPSKALDDDFMAEADALLNS